jgi:predicted mannosyl-3-phosphoglycerate phosphatase (HAD superfamily)
MKHRPRTPSCANRIPRRGTVPYSRRVHTETAHSGAYTASGTLVIFTRVDGLLRERPAGRDRTPCELSRDALHALISTRVPLVLVSDSDAADMRQMQRELGLMQPFISRGGAALHIPPEYFSQVDDVPASEDQWEMFSFDTIGPAAAMRLLGALFLARGHDKILTVGLGCDTSDGAMLAAVDIPIVVRDQRLDQSALLRYVPGAYLTSATGAAGWLEAVVGPSR